MKNRKITVFLMALLMTAMMTTPAFAGNASPTTRIEASCAIPDIIVVTVPTNANVVINPYDVSVNFRPAYGQILTEPVSIHNQSAAPVKVSVTATGEVNEGSDLALVGASTAGVTTKAKRAFVYFEIQPTSEANPENFNDWDSAFDAEKHLIIRAGAKSKKNIVTLGAGDENAPADSKCYGAFRLTGDCVDFPASGWQDADGFRATIAFSFTLTHDAPN